MNKISLLQPRHIYAPSFDEHKQGHIYMPTSLISISSILRQANVEVTFNDENIEPYFITEKIIGINLLGAPYIPYGVKLAKKMASIFGENNFRLLIGGQVVSGLSDIQFQSLFGKNSINGNDFSALTSLFNIKHNKLNSVEKVSFVDGYSLIDNKHLKLYLQNELSFYLSNGCKYSCTFCGAQRSRINPKSKVFERCTEKYRDISNAIVDLNFLIQKAIEFNLNKLDIYLTNLDLFQTPEKLSEFIDGVITLKTLYKGFDIRMRALANVSSFLELHRKNPNVLKKLVQSGFYRVGFGIDGASPIIWKNTKKPHTKSDCIKAIHIAKSNYDITPEILMVFGFNNFENKNTLKQALDFSYEMSIKYGALPRPHVAKELIPGSDNWFKSEYQDKVDVLLKNPILFQHLDFTALPSSITHENETLRELISDYYMQICSLPNSLTQYIKPVPLTSNSISDLKAIENFNKGRYDF